MQDARIMHIWIHRTVDDALTLFDSVGTMAGVCLLISSGLSTGTAPLIVIYFVEDFNSKYGL